MLGIIGTIGVVCQMALLSTGYSVKLALVCGLIACAAWMGHAVKLKDPSLLVTNVVVAGFAIFGIAN
jgi:hypothetical protein